MVKPDTELPTESLPGVMKGKHREERESPNAGIQRPAVFAHPPSDLGFD